MTELYVFLVQRPMRDRNPWVLACDDKEIAERYPHRVSTVGVAIVTMLAEAQESKP